MFNGLGFSSMATNDGTWAASNDYPVDVYTRRLTRGAQPTRRQVTPPARRVNAFAHLFEVPAPARPVKVRKRQRNQIAAARCTCPPQPQRTNDYARFRPLRPQVETMGDTIELGDLGKTPKKLNKTALKALPPQFRAAWEAQPVSTPGWSNTQPQLVTPVNNRVSSTDVVVDGGSYVQPLLEKRAEPQPQGASKFDTITSLIETGLNTVREIKTAPRVVETVQPQQQNVSESAVGANAGIGFSPNGSLSLGGGLSVSPMVLLGVGGLALFLVMKKK